ncbi:MAG: ferrichrome ABC transporter permease [Chloroflexota bacterium]
MLPFLLGVFLSAFLLFQIQPMIAKTVLPWYGGATAVWSSVQLFFQVVLVGGYAYAHWVARRGARAHLILILLVGLQLLALNFLWGSPVTPPSAWKPDGDANPIWQILALLAVSVGPAYFALSSNSPLVQVWFHRVAPARSPYALYALSNIGSLLGLLTFPFLFEPRLDSSTQGILWTGGFFLFALATLVNASRGARAGQPVSDSAGPSEVAAPAPGLGRRAAWIALSACASALFLAMTSHITQEVAVIPFLWVLPLAIYLLSFILAFASERWYPRHIFTPLLFLACIAFVAAQFRGRDLLMPAQLTVALLLLFVACMVCHGELYRLRPSPSRLTNFYLMVSIGGALGGAFVNFAAPALFDGYWEVQFGVVFLWLLLLVLAAFERRDSTKRVARLVTLTLALYGFALTAFWAVAYIYQISSHTLFADRNFYGVSRVLDQPIPGTTERTLALSHGLTLHGIQVDSDALRNVPLGYYYEQTGIGLAIANHPRRGGGMRVGVLGGGAGMIAVYGQAGDAYRFYEINPTMIALAEGQGGYFSYLSDSPAQMEIVLGDARISLERELESGQPQNFDLLAMDAFSSDSVPVHLLDKEAFAVYLQHLNPRGILAVNITNTYLDLKPVVFRLAQEYDLTMLDVESEGDGKFLFETQWILLSRDPTVLEQPAIVRYAQTMEGYSTDIPLWTDRYSNLFQILRWR